MRTVMRRGASVGDASRARTRGSPLDAHALDAWSCAPGSGPRARARVLRGLRTTHTELPEELAQPEEGTQHRAGVRVLPCAELPARDLGVERFGDGVEQRACAVVGGALEPVCEALEGAR